MEGHRFDALSRNLALAADRRAVMRGAAGGGFLALLGTLLRGGRRVSAQEEPVTCTWQIEARGSSGPNRLHSYNGILEITIEPDGAIDSGTYTLVDGSWHPLVDSHGDEIAFDVVGSSHIRSIDFRVEHDGCGELAFTGVNRFLVRECKGPMSGPFQGPELIDLGGWRTRRRDICPPCRGTVCPPDTYLDSDSCECIPKCPGGHRTCKDLVCVPEECPEGYYYDEELCICGCKEKKCKRGEIWCPFICDCVPWDPCTEFECPPGYVHYLFGEDLCICTKNPCYKEVVCAEGEILIYDGITCKCVGKDGCEEHKCDEGYVWDEPHCGCIPRCEKKECDQGYVWDDKACDCLPTECPPIECPNGNYGIDPKTCQCYCVEQQCGGNYKWDPDSCSCYCPQIVCDQGYDFNPDTCECVPGGCVPQECGPREEWNPDYCKCVCAYEECSGYYVWSYDTCSCVCGIYDCGEGYVLDKDQCYCNPYDPCATAPACPDGTVRNPDNCQCYCPENDEPLCEDDCNSYYNCGKCGNNCNYGCCGGLCCIG